MIKSQVIKTEQDFRDLKDRWITLLSMSRANNIFLTWEWMFTWWSVFGGRNELCIVVAEQDDEVVGIAPLYVSPEKCFGVLPYRKLGFIGDKYVGAEYLDYIVKESCETEVVREICKQVQATPWDVFEVPGALEDAQVYRFAMNESRKSVLVGNGFCSPYVLLPESWEDLLKSLSKKKRFNVRHYRRRLEKETAVKYFTVTGEDDLDYYFDALVDLNKKRMAEKGVDVRGTFHNPSFVSFHRKVAHLMLEKGCLLLSFLTVEGNPAATRYDFEYDNKVYSYQVGHDTRYNDKSVGNVCLGFCIEEAIRRGNREYDFLMGDEAYKLEWTKLARAQVSFRCCRNGALRGKLVLGMDRLWAGAKGCAKQMLVLRRDAEKSLG